MVLPVEASGKNMPVHTEIEIAELHQLLENPDCTALVVDVREPEEYVGGHLPGAVNWPLSRLDERLSSLPRDRSLVLYSGHGRRSAEACSRLHEAGFHDLCHLRGGLEAWRTSGLLVA